MPQGPLFRGDGSSKGSTIPHCLPPADLTIQEKGQWGNPCCKQVSAKAEKGSGKGHDCEYVTDNDHTSLTCLWLLFVSQSFHFILSETLEEALLQFPLGSTPSWHIPAWCRKAETFPFGGTRTKTGSGNSARGFCMKEVSCLHNFHCY